MEGNMLKPTVTTLRRKLGKLELKLSEKDGMYCVYEHSAAVGSWVPTPDCWSEVLTHPLHFDDVLDIIAERQSA